MITHDKLQASAHIWMWNSFPQCRQLFHSNFNDIKVVESGLRSVTGQSIGQARSIIISKMKAIGLVAGTFDQEFFYNGKLYYLDAKIPPDTLSIEQLAFKRINEFHGAECFTYTTLEEFQQIINQIL